MARSRKRKAIKPVSKAVPPATQTASGDKSESMVAASPLSPVSPDSQGSISQGSEADLPPSRRIQGAKGDAAPKQSSSDPRLVTVKAFASPAKSGMSVATGVGGMVLTLILGLYIGSLLPGIFMKEAADTLPQSSPPSANTQGESSPLPSELQQRLNNAEKLAAADPGSAPDWINLGNAYFDAHEPQKAIHAYEHALSLAPKNPDVLTDLGIMYREIGEFEKALECFRKATAVEENHQPAMFNMGVVLAYDLQRHKEAIEIWERLLRINPQAQTPDGKSISEIIRELPKKNAMPQGK